MSFFSGYNTAYDTNRGIDQDALARRRVQVADEQANLNAMRAREIDKINREPMAQAPAAPQAKPFTMQEAVAPKSAPIPLAADSPWRGRTEQAPTDNAIEISEMSRRLQALKQRGQVPQTLGNNTLRAGFPTTDSALQQERLARDLAARGGQGTSPGWFRPGVPVGHAILNNPRQQQTAAPTPQQAVDNTPQIDAMGQRLRDLQGVDAARQRGQAPVQGGVLNPEFFARQRKVESNNNPNAVSPKGAVGTMQTMPKTLEKPGYGVVPARDNSDAERQRVGEDYMRAMLREYGNLPDALAAYNWGPGNFNNWKAAGADPARMPAETRNYVAMLSGGQQQALQQAPQQAPQQAQPAPGLADNRTFTPEQTVTGNSPMSFLSMQIQGKVANLTRQLQHLTGGALVKARETVQLLQQDVYQIEVVQKMVADAHINESRLSELAQLGNVPLAKTEQGFVVVDPTTGKAVSAPMSMSAAAGHIAQRVSEAFLKAAQQRQATMDKNQGAIDLENVKSRNTMQQNEQKMYSDITLKAAEFGLSANEIKVNYDPVNGGAIVHDKNGRVWQFQPESMTTDGVKIRSKLSPMTLG